MKKIIAVAAIAITASTGMVNAQASAPIAEGQVVTSFGQTFVSVLVGGVLVWALVSSASSSTSSTTPSS